MIGALDQTPLLTALKGAGLPVAEAFIDWPPENEPALWKESIGVESGRLIDVAFYAPTVRWRLVDGRKFMAALNPQVKKRPWRLGPWEGYSWDLDGHRMLTELVSLVRESLET